MPIKPEEQANKLIAWLSKLTLRRSENINFELRRVKQEIEKVKESDFIGWLQLKGMTAAVEANISEVRTRFDMALSQSHSDSVVYLNYAISLYYCFHFTDTTEFIRIAYSNMKGDKEVLDLLISVLAYSGRFKEALEFCYEADKIELDGQTFPKEKIQGACDTMTRYDIPEEKIAGLIKISENVAKEFNIIPCRAYSSNDPGEHISYEFLFNATSNVTKQMQDRFYDMAWREKLSDIVDKYVSVYFVPADEIVEDEFDKKKMKPGPAIPLAPTLMAEIGELVSGVVL